VQHHERERREGWRRAVRRPAPGTFGELRPGALLPRSAALQDPADHAGPVAGVGARWHAAARAARRGARSIRSRAGAQCRRTHRAHRVHLAGRAGVVRSLLPGRGTRRARRRSRRAVALDRTPRGHPAAGTGSVQNVVRGCACHAGGTAGTPAQSSRSTGTTAENMNTMVATFEQSVQRELARVIVGAEDVIRALCIALIARGHVLVQGPPGLGKTLLAKTLARVLGGEFKRVQGTA